MLNIGIIRVNKGRVRIICRKEFRIKRRISFLPLMYSRLNRQDLIKEAVELAKSVEDETTQLQMIAGILTATDKFIDEEYAKKVRE